MGNTKYLLLEGNLYDYTYFEDRLTRLSAEGWHLEKVGSLLWKFRRGEPMQVRYAVTYAPSASAFNSRPTDEEEDLSDLCAQAGWIRVGTRAQMHIYRNEDPNATPLETDDIEKLRNIRRTMWRHFFPQEALFIVIFLLQFFMHLRTLNRWPTTTLSSSMMISTLVTSLLVAVIHGFLTLSGMLWLRRAGKALENGAALPVNRFYRWFRWVTMAFLCAYLLCLLGSVGLGFVSWVIITAAAVLLFDAGALNLCKKLKAPRWVNIVVPSGVCLLIMAVMIPVLIFGMERTFTEEPLGSDIPLTLQQLTGETGTDRAVLEQQGSILSAYGRYRDKGSDDTRLSYTIVDVKCPLFYDMLLDEQEDEFQIASHYTADPEAAAPAELFGAEYARHARTGLGDYWLICWDSRIVYLKATWELTGEQTAILAEVLRPQ